MPRYRINPGRSFRMEDGSIKSAGEVIELGEDVAAANPGAAEPVPDEAPADLADTPATPAGDNSAGDQ